MSFVRMSPEFIATLKEGLFEVVRGAAVPGAKVREVRLERGPGEDFPCTVVIDVDDGLDLDREIVFRKVDRYARHAGGEPGRCSWCGVEEEPCPRRSRYTKRIAPHEFGR